MTPLSHCEQLNNFTNNTYQTATVEKRFPDFWQVLPEWQLYRCLGYSDTSEYPENTTLIWLLSFVNNMLGELAVLPVQSQPVWAEIPC
jgi:membrane-bound acyltransferase YfiQ involved in biofilm formation